MSIPVDLPSLDDVMARYAFAYLLTSAEGGPPHAVAVVPRFRDGLLVLDEIGRPTRANLVAQPEVALVWPPTSIAEYSLIVDGRAAVDEDCVWIAPSRAVLHRPAHRSSPAAPGVCGSDCLELPVATARSRSRPPSA